MNPIVAYILSRLPVILPAVEPVVIEAIKQLEAEFSSANPTLDAGPPEPEQAGIDAKIDAEMVDKFGKFGK